jgi:hypothetical protein
MSNLERMARKIAAEKMGLVKDVLGENLPDELWRQAITLAEARLHSEALYRVAGMAEALALFELGEGDAPDFGARELLVASRVALRKEPAP